MTAPRVYRGSFAIALAACIATAACKDDSAAPSKADPKAAPQVNMAIAINGEAVEVKHATLVSDSPTKLRLFLTPDPIDCTKFDPEVASQTELVIHLEAQPNDAGTSTWAVVKHSRAVHTPTGFTSSSNNYTPGGNVQVGPSQGGTVPIGINFEHSYLGWSASIKGGVNAKTCPSPNR